MTLEYNGLGRKQRNVLATKALPTRVPLWQILVYGLYVKVYDLPLWSTILVFSLLLLAVVFSLISIGGENQVDPLN